MLFFPSQPEAGEKMADSDGKGGALCMTIPMRIVETGAEDMQVSQRTSPSGKRRHQANAVTSLIEAPS